MHKENTACGPLISNFVFSTTCWGHSWGMGRVVQVGAASAATAAQYTGAAVMLAMMVRKGLLLPAQAGDLPPLRQWGATLRPGIPFAFCIASVVASLLFATNLATGASWAVPSSQCKGPHASS